MSRYLKIASDLKHRIVHQEFDCLLPTHHELAQYYNTSRMTISKAIQVLKIEGWLMTDRRNGTFIRPRKIERYAYDTPIDHYDGGTAYYGSRGTLSTRVIAFAIQPAEDHEIDHLQLDEGDLVYNIIRLRLMNDQPIVLEYTVMPVDLIPNVTEEVLHHSIYRHICNNLNLMIGAASRRIRADRSDVYDHMHLKCAPNTPILEIEQVVFLEDGRPFEFSQTRYPYDVTEFTYTTFHHN
ncbi:GntR family transcriptional regulator [Allofustis seminis]|uniref:GntR family transcriptional regulator n=1 Tax=Allofustis seminis TaxID=166939 RepID=UPI00037D3D38|nr:GntR family transcriptional regulator [Allofustis seminis]